MAGIYICYRPDDGAEYGERLYDELQRRFGSDLVSMDINAWTIDGTRNFFDFLYARTESPRAMLVIIDSRWLISRPYVHSPGQPDDLVQLQIEYALDHDVYLIPVLLDGARMPGPEDLPQRIRRLAYRNPFDLRTTHWLRDVDFLASYLDFNFMPRPSYRNDPYASPGSAPPPADSPSDWSVPDQSDGDWRGSFDPWSEPAPSSDSPSPSAGPPDDEDWRFSAPSLDQAPEPSLSDSAWETQMADGATASDDAAYAGPPPDAWETSVPFGAPEIVEQPLPPPPPSSAVPGRSTARLLGRLPALAASRPEASPTVDADEVHCSAFAPPRVTRGRFFLVQVIAYLPEHAELARQIAVEHDLGATRRGAVALTLQLPRGATLGFTLRMSELDIVDIASATMVWRGSPTSVAFEVRVPRSQPIGMTTGRILIDWDGVPIGDIRFQVEVIGRGKRHGRTPLEPTGTSSQRFQQAFVSYASPDRVEVLKRVQGITRAGIRCFQDVLDLEPGDRWAQELYRRIDESDLFYLFWSRAARDSEWVRKELLYAIERQAGDKDAPPLIKPIPLETAIVAEPPPELAYLHFHDPFLDHIEAQAARQASRQGNSSPRT